MLVRDQVLSLLSELKFLQKKKRPKSRQGSLMLATALNNNNNLYYAFVYAHG